MSALTTSHDVLSWKPQLLQLCANLSKKKKIQKKLQGFVQLPAVQVGPLGSFANLLAQLLRQSFEVGPCPSSNTLRIDAESRP
jgi:hypothetical protein